MTVELHFMHVTSYSFLTFFVFSRFLFQDKKFDIFLLTAEMVRSAVGWACMVQFKS